MTEPYLISFFVYGTIAFVLLSAIIMYMLVVQNQRRYAYRNEKNERENQFKNELLNTQIELQEHLLNEVSQEIHDNVAQVLSLVKVNLFSVSNLSTDNKAIALAKTSSELLDKAIDDLRNISHRNNADLLRRTGLKEALRKELKYLDGSKKQEIILELFGEHYTMPPEQELLIYRIAQEAIHNCIKHAKASVITVSLFYEPTNFTLKISDNGVGFNLAQSDYAHGIGLSNMTHRAKVLGSKLIINSELLRGTTLTLKIQNLNGQ